MATPPTLTLGVIQAVPKVRKFQLKETKLGDGYEQVVTVGKSSGLVDYSITTDYLNLIDASSLLNQLSNWRGVQAFYWTPNESTEPLRLFTCKQWQLTLTNAVTRQFTATFEGVIL